MHGTPLSLIKWENELRNKHHEDTHTYQFHQKKDEGTYKKTPDRTKQELTGNKIFIRDLRQILPRGGGAFLATGTGTGTFSSGTGFLRRTGI